MLRSNLFVASLCLVGIASAFGCGDDTGTGGNGGAAAAGVQPPGRPEGAGPGDGSGVVFGTTHIYIGTKTRAGAATSDAWKDFGYDLDGQITTSDYTNHCKPAGGATPGNSFPDGTDGIDNSFGKNLLPVIKTAAGTQVSDLEASLNGAIEDGSFNIMVNIKNLGTAADYDPLDSLLLAGKEGNVATNTWKAAPEFLNDTTDPDSAKVTFPNSYLSGNTWVSGDKGTVELNIAIAGFNLSLEIQSAVITMELDAAHGGATKGIIAGVLNTEALISSLRDVIGAVDPSLCEGTAVEGILNLIRQASDIMDDGSQDPASECNGISIGLGFDATAVTVDGVGAASPPADPPCQGGGGTGGSGTGGAGGAG